MRSLPASLAFVLSAVAWAGPLNPPAGPVAPTMKTLDEVEPRTPVQRLPAGGGARHLIAQPGSYYLAANITMNNAQSAITIAADNVTLDLNGFTIDGGGVGASAVLIDAERTGTVIRNGFVKSFAGITINGEESDDTTVVGLRITASGQEAIFLGQRSMVRECVIRGAVHGILLDSSSIVTDCVVEATRGITTGSDSLVQDCTVDPPGLPGITVGQNSRVEGCAVEAGATNGIQAGDNSIVRNSTVQGATMSGVSVAAHCRIEGVVSRNNGLHGFFMTNFTTIEGCTARNNGRYGIFANSGCRVLGNSVFDNSTAGAFGGVKLPGSNALCDGNQVYNSRVGIDADFASNTIVRNVCYANTVTNYEIAAGNRVGTLQANPAVAGPWDNISY